MTETPHLPPGRSAIQARRLAIGLVILGAASNSTGGLFVRSLEAASEWQTVFWRTLSLAVAVSAILVFQHRGHALSLIRQTGWRAVLGGMFYGATLAGYVLALNHTTVANVDFTLSGIPIFTAILAWLVLGERVRLRTVLAIAATACGIALMLGDGLNVGSVDGNLMAIGAAASFACFVVVLRHGRAVSMLPAIIVGALLAAAFAAVMTGGSLAVTPRDLAICLTWGGVTSCIAHSLIVIAARRLAGAEVALLVMFEFILGPTWVWLIIGETPSALTLIGGAIVLSAVGGHTLAALRTDQD